MASGFGKDGNGCGGLTGRTIQIRSVDSIIAAKILRLSSRSRQGKCRREPSRKFHDKILGSSGPGSTPRQDTRPERAAAQPIWQYLKQFFQTAPRPVCQEGIFVPYGMPKGIKRDAQAANPQAFGIGQTVRLLPFKESGLDLHAGKP